MRIARILFATTILYACTARAQHIAPGTARLDKLPPPGCDSYSLQTLPLDGFGRKQRACFWRNELFTGTAFTGAAFWGAIGEWRHKPPEWPQGFDGFGRQMGTRYAQGMVKSTTTFVAGIITREDPRLDPPPVLGCSVPTRVPGRIAQSLKRVVWSYRDNGGCRGRPAPARLIGSFASGFVSLAWMPPSQNRLNNALTGSGTAFAGYIGHSLFSEFQGDLYRLIGRIATGKPHSTASSSRTPGKEAAE